MGLFHKNSQGSRRVLQLLIINLVCWFGWFFEIVLAQVELFQKAFESLDFPLEAITCLANILVFKTSLIRGRLDFDNGAREVLDTLTDPKLKTINGINAGTGLTTCTLEEEVTESGFTEGKGLKPASTEKEEATETTNSREEKGLKTASVVVLSNGTPNSSMKRFMKSNARIHNVHSILLQFLPLMVAAVTVETYCECRACNCIIFSTLEEITIMLAHRMPGTLKRLSDSMCLLPCLTCLKNGCHGCDQGLLYVEMEPCAELRERLTVGDPKVESPDVVCEILNLDGVLAGRSIMPRMRICICIPVHPAPYDDWTKLLLTSFRSKDAEDRGVRVMASEALQEYLDGEGGRRNRGPVIEYNTGSCIGPRLSEILINLVLTFWFTLDGFSSAYVARRTIRNYLVDSQGSGLAANSFLIKATVKFNADNTHVCQVLTFRGNRFSVITLSFIAGGVNLICFIGWAVLIAFEGGDSAPPLSVARVVIIIIAIGIALFMDCFYSFSNCLFHNERDYKVLFVIILEIVSIIALSVVAKIWGLTAFGKWIYGALQGLVWIKWGIGSYILDKSESFWYKFDHWGVLVYSSAFLLNAALGGVRSTWTPSWPWKDNHLFSVKLKP